MKSKREKLIRVAGILAGLFLGLGAAVWFSEVEQDGQRSREEEPKILVPQNRKHIQNGIEPPKLVQATHPVPEMRPGAQGYDSYRLAAIIKPKAIFYQEPRDEAWAAPVETYLTTSFSKDLKALLGTSYDAKIECRTTVCRVSWTVSEEKPASPIRHAFMEILSGMYLGSIASPEPPNEVFMVYSGGIDKLQTGDPDSLIAWLKRRRVRHLEGMRSGRIRFTRPKDALLSNATTWPLE